MVSLYAKGMTTGDIQAHLAEIYGVKVGRDLISRVTDAVMDDVRAWAQRLPSGQALRVGLCWAGQARPWLTGFVGLDGRRSTHLATLAPLVAVPGVQLVSLQKGPAAAEVAGAWSVRAGVSR